MGMPEGIVMHDNLRLMVAVPPQWYEQFVGDDLLSTLKPWFHDVVRIDPTNLSLKKWHSNLAEVEPHAILSSWGTPTIPREARPALGFVSHTAGEIRRLVGRELIEEGLLVSNWGELAAPSVAECALLLMLCSLRRVTHWSFVMHRERGWPDGGETGNVGLFGRKVGLHGFGKIAQSLVALLKPFGCQIMAYSAGVPDEVFAAHGVTQADSLEALFSQSEILVEVEALTDATRRSVTEDLLRLLPPDGAFINVGRGAVVDEQGLINVAREGNIQFALDVFEMEPLATTSPLRGLPNVTLLPHIAGPTVDRRKECGRRAIDNLQRFARGEKPIGLVTLDVYDRST